MGRSKELSYRLGLVDQEGGLICGPGSVGGIELREEAAGRQCEEVGCMTPLAI